MSEAKKTPYYDFHVSQGAKIVDFVGFLMPMQYEGIKKEHMAVRQQAGLFDVAHMGEILFKGEGALDTVNALITNDLNLIPDNHALYTPICYENGGIVDDCIVYKRSASDIMIVVNASNKDKDYKWMLDNYKGVKPIDQSDDWALLALQGPDAEHIMHHAFDADLSSIPGFGLGWINAFGQQIMVARTGYTGEDGFEIFVPTQFASAAYETIMNAGKPHGMVAAGLGARDTLRLEARLWLYGNDIDATTTPLEAGMNFTLKFDNHDFIGRAALLKQKEEGLKRKLVGFKATGKGIPREHFNVLDKMPSDGGRIIGQVTSGTKCPFLNESVGLAYVETAFSKPGTALVAEHDGKCVEIELVKGSFYKRSGK